MDFFEGRMVFFEAWIVFFEGSFARSQVVAFGTSRASTAGSTWPNCGAAF
jgi:hypothetical protein